MKVVNAVLKTLSRINYLGTLGIFCTLLPRTLHVYY